MLKVRMIAIAWVGLIFTLPIVHAGGVDDNEKIGFSPNHVFHGALAGENIDIMNGNVNLNLPIGPEFRLTDHFAWQINLFYNSKIWNNECDVLDCHGRFPNGDSYGQGFLLHFGRIYHHPRDKANQFRFQSSDGGEHRFCHDLEGTDPCETMEGRNTQGVTRDSSSYRIDPTGSGWRVNLGNGTMLLLENQACDSDGDCTYAPYDVPSDSGNPDAGWYTTVIRTVAEDAGVPRAEVRITYESAGYIGDPSATSAEIDSITDYVDGVAQRTVDFRRVSNGAQGESIFIDVPTFAGSATPDAATFGTYELVLEPMTVQDPEIARPGQSTQVWVGTNYCEGAPEEGHCEAASGAAFWLYKTLNQPYVTGWEESRKYVSRQFLKEIRIPGLDPSDSHRFDYDDGLAFDLQTEPFGMLTSWTVPTGATAQYRYGHYQSSPYRPVHSEVRYRDLTIDPTGPPYRWTYTRLGNTVYHSFADVLESMTDESANPSISNPHKVRVLDPLDNLTVYYFLAQNYVLWNVTGSTDSQCNACGCKNDWDNGLLYRIDHFAGPHEDASQLVRQERFSYEHDGVTKQVTEEDCYDINFNTEPINVRKSVREVTNYPRHGMPGSFLRTEYDDWANRDENGAPDLLWAPVSRKTVDLRDGQPYRTRWQDFSGDPNFPREHTVSVLLDKNGVAVERTDVEFEGWRPKKIIKRLDPTFSMATYLPDSIAYPGDVVTTHEYDTITGNLISTAVTGGDNAPSGNYSIDYGYNLGTLTWKDYGSLLTVMDRTVDGNTGLALSSRDPAGNETEYDWDEIGRLTSIAPGLPEPTIDIAYPDLTRTVVTRIVEGDNFTQEQYDYDPLGRVVKESRRHVNNGDVHRYNVYDIYDRLTAQSIWVENDSDLAWTQTEYSFVVPDPVGGGTMLQADPLGRVSRVTQPDGSSVRFLYGGNSKTTIVEGVETENGLEDVVTVFESDEFGQLTLVDSPGDGADATYGYDERGNLTSVELWDPVEEVTQARAFTFDALGNLRLAANPENGTVEYQKYNPRGQAVEWRDAAGNQIEKEYDAAGQPTSVEAPGVKLDWSWNWGKIIHTWSEEDGEIVASIAYSFGTDESSCGDTLLSEDYDGQQSYRGNNRRLTSISATYEDGTARDVLYCYDKIGKPNITFYPPFTTSQWSRTRVGVTRWNGYDVGIHDLGRSTPTEVIEYARGIQYRPDGLITGFTRTNGLQNAIQRDVLGRPTSFELFSPNGPSAPANGPQTEDEAFGCGGGSTSGGYVHPMECHQLHTPPSAQYPASWHEGPYTYDGAGNILSIGGKTYQYDALGRLKGAVIPQTFADIGLSYTYDAFGNMDSRIRTGLQTSNRQFSNDPFTNRLSSYQDGVRQYDITYDPNGNMTSDGEQFYVWDALGRLQQVWSEESGLTAEYDYDAEGNRVRKAADGIETFYYRNAEGQLLSEFSRSMDDSAAPVWRRDHIYGLGQALSVVKNRTPEPTNRPWVIHLTTSELWLKWEEAMILDFRRFIVHREICDEECLVGQPCFGRIAESTTGTSYTDTFESGLDFDPDRELCYRIETLDGAGQSIMSPVLRVRPFDDDPPPQPGGVVVNALEEACAVDWTWDTLTDDLWGYFVEGREAGESQWIRLTEEPVTTKPYLQFGLENGQEYEYRVIAIDTSGRESTASLVASGTPEDTTAPSPPSGFHLAAGLNEAELSASWNPSTSSDVVKYVVVFECEDQSCSQSVVETAGAELAITGLTVNKVYRVWVIAEDDSGNQSTQTPIKVARTRGDLDAPTGFTGTIEEIGEEPSCAECNVSCEANLATRVALSWDSDDEGKRIYRAMGETGDFVELATVSSSEAECVASVCTFYDEEPGAEQSYYIVSVDGDKESAAAGGSSGVLQLTDGYYTDHEGNYREPTVTRMSIQDGSNVYQTDNAKARLVTLTWSPINEPELKGYHVYRRCRWVACWASFGLNGLQQPSLRAPECVHSWQRLTLEPTPLNSFADSELGGIGGCYEYMVRAVGPDGKEGPGVYQNGGHANLWAAENSEGGAQCHTEFEMVDIDTKRHFNDWFDSGTGIMWYSPTTHTCKGNWLDSYPMNPEPQPALPDWVPEWEQGFHGWAELCRVNQPRPAGEVDHFPPSKPVVWNFNESSCHTPYMSPVNQQSFFSSTCTSPAYAIDEYNVRSDHTTYNYLPEYNEWIPRDTLYASVTWHRNPEPDIAGYHIEMSFSEKGPWKRVTARPVAWFEHRFDYRGLWIEDPAAGWYGPDCALFRVVAIDEAGRESEPSDPMRVRPFPEDHPDGPNPEPAQFECSQAATPMAPSSLQATTTGNTEFNCTTRVTWDAPYGGGACSADSPRPGLPCSEDTECDGTCTYPPCGPPSCEADGGFYRTFRFEVPTDAIPNENYRFQWAGDVPFSECEPSEASATGWTCSEEWTERHLFAYEMESVAGSATFNQPVSHVSSSPWTNADASYADLSTVATAPIHDDDAEIVYKFEGGIASGEIVALIEVETGTHPYHNASLYYRTEPWAAWTEVDNEYYIEPGVIKSGPLQDIDLSKLEVRLKSHHHTCCQTPEPTAEFRVWLVNFRETSREGQTSFRSERAFWDCWETPGYSRNELPGVNKERVDPVQTFDRLAALHPKREREEAPAPPSATAPLPPRPRLSPYLTLGQAIAYDIYDLHVDHLGSTRLMTDMDGYIVSQHEFLPFGEEITGMLDATTKRFTGHERDRESGLDYMFARYYSANHGRFLGVDPVPGTSGVPQSWNRYGYVRNNPLNRVDPDGEFAVTAGAAAYYAAAAIGAYLVMPNPGDPRKTNAEVMGESLIEGGKWAMDTAKSLVEAVQNKFSDSSSAGSGSEGTDGNSNPYNGPVSTPVTVVDEAGNAIPVGKGEQITASPDGSFQQVRDSDGRPTGVRLDGPHKPQSHPGNPEAQRAHAHRPGVVNESGNPQLPVKENLD